MHSFRTNILYFTLFEVVAHIQCLVKLPAAEDDIAATERIIRGTFNSIFVALNIKDVKQNVRLKQFSTIHNFFVSITLTDCDNLKEISRLTRVNDVDNNTIHFIALLNEALNDDVSVEVKDKDVYVYSDTFINKLRDFKEIYQVDDKGTNSAADVKILKYLNTDTENLTNFDVAVENKTSNPGKNVLYDYEYWRPEIQSGRRIFKGQKTRIKYFPFMASVHAFKKFQCAGSIIHKDLVITAASCLQLAWNNAFFRENPSFLSVQIGSDFYESGGEYIAAQEIYFHPGYSTKNLRNNLALMRLAKEIVFSEDEKRVKKIEMDKNASPLPSYVDSVTVVGWGVSDSKDITIDPPDERLKFATLDYYTLIDCQEIYTKEYVTRNNFCAGFYSKGSGACSRDIGGPGIVDGKLIGVISFGSPTCGTPDTPTVFTKIGFYKDWIESIIKKNKPKAALPSERTATIQPVFINYQTLPTEEITPDGIPKNLKIVQDGKVFKDFLSTVLSSGEGIDIQLAKDKETIEMNEEETTTTVKTTHKRKVKTKPDKKLFSDKTRANDASPKAIERAEKPQTDEIISKSDDMRLESDIANLLKELDIYNLLEPSGSNHTRTVVEIGNKRSLRKKGSVKTFLLLSDKERAEDVDDVKISAEYSN
ncbi:uncharacterized protein LOC142982733 [Anticarsia gemmatalis]|uniref:uncharacterized protein LOC142982733 n=1 Tax=Anticarsia gemmatalis TaxID=129554 RepID=UPI003F761BF0